MLATAPAMAQDRSARLWITLEIPDAVGEKPYDREEIQSVGHSGDRSGAEKTDPAVALSRIDMTVRYNHPVLK